MVKVEDRTSKSKGSEKTHSLPLKRMFTKEGAHPFDHVQWGVRKIMVRGTNGHKEERELEFPNFWSDNAANIAGSKYFRGRIGTDERETSVRQMIGRVADTIRGWGVRFGYFGTEAEASIFADELTHILLHQKAAFNSPVWFNAGVEDPPQCSACFILSIGDNMESILQWIYNEGMIFKRGSGAGINLSPLRSTRETLSKGGHSSGPVSFMRGADAVAGMIASGGSTRRAAKMVVLNIDHPDIMQFIRCKAEEEKKVRAFIQGGYNMYDLNNPAWNSIQYQNANNSVRVTDEFMHAVENDEKFKTRFILSGEVGNEYRARDLMKAIGEAAWESGDPGIQYDTTINRWHTCPNTGRINASNPCSEYMHLDDSACNLASINLVKYLNKDGTFNVKEFVHTVDIMILAQEIIVGGSSYPTEKITKNAKDFRELGLGYANLGALLMTMGMPYDSDEARHSAAAITALMCGEAYRYSAEIARRMGPFDGYQVNKEPMLNVISMHRDQMLRVRETMVFDRAIYQAAEKAWGGAVSASKRYGVRNSQVTVLAPTGTIALMMDSATTGIEPEFALVKTKQLVGGGVMKFVNTEVPHALQRLGYSEEEVAAITNYLKKIGTIEGAPDLKEKHLAVFDCAVKPANGMRSIHWQGHVKMVAAAQQFISGAISKTFNMSYDVTPEEIVQAYVMGWKLGLKAFAVYRDGSKAAQPLTTSTGLAGKTEEKKAVRRRLPATRPSETHKFSIAGHEGYLTYSMYENSDLAEIFIRMSKQGSTLAGLLDAFAIAISIALQHGVPLKILIQKFAYGRFEPAGYTENPELQVVTSITDYIFRYLAMRFLDAEMLEEVGIQVPVKEVTAATTSTTVVIQKNKEAVLVRQEKTVVYADSVCRMCGGMLIQTGTCKTCMQCGTSNGGC
ncbi:MAG: vitamin B12-dependent ribonucleotide reductase [Candidatus Sungbacteria bacterium]|nr:vitamin B12-dependent ribonucleotide reductase [Candidatus Sungbacteria bacterium]